MWKKENLLSTSNKTQQKIRHNNYSQILIWKILDVSLFLCQQITLLYCTSFQSKHRHKNYIQTLIHTKIGVVTSSLTSLAKASLLYFLYMFVVHEVDE